MHGTTNKLQGKSFGEDVGAEGIPQQFGLYIFCVLQIYIFFKFSIHHWSDSFIAGDGI
jgi:hypothetical protein